MDRALSITDTGARAAGIDPDLAQRVAAFAASLPPRAPYRPPTPAEREEAATAILAAWARHPADSLAGLGFSVQESTDSATGRDYVLVASEPGAERGWGCYVAEPAVTPRLVIEVPHPNSDLYTERAGVALHRLEPGSVLLLAGAHRRAGRRAADVAHREDSVFHAVAARLAQLGLPQIQLHGFVDASLPGTDLILSAGAGEATPAHDETADALRDAGFTVCRAWAGGCGGLEGTTNVQGRLAARLGTPFLHVEINRTTRQCPHRRAAVVRALAAFG